MTNPTPDQPRMSVPEAEAALAPLEAAVRAGRQAQQTETDEERADREKTERDHARGDHTYCGITCEVELPTEHLRNFVIAKGYPGTKGALDELLRRAAASAVLSEPTDQAEAHRLALSEALGLGNGVDSDTVANRAAKAISAMGADIRALKRDRDRYRTAWRSARQRAAVLSAEITRRAPLLGEYAAQIAHLRTMYDVATARTNDLIEERDQLLEAPTGQAAVRAAALHEAADAADRLSMEIEQALRTREVGPLTALQDLADELRRLADEQPTTPTTETLLTLVRDFLDPDPCSFDHHGYCQAHAAGFGGEPLSCPHGRARKLLAAPAKEA